MDARLTFVNQSLDVSGTEVVFFQHDRLAAEVAPIAWKVIRHCGPDCSHPFVLPEDLVLAVFDAWGNSIANRVVVPHTRITVERPDDRVARLLEQPYPRSAIEVMSAVPQGVINLFLARQGRAVTPWKTLVPGQVATFDIEAGLHAVAFNGLMEGDSLPPDALACTNHLNLDRVARAQILMLGGGWGPRATRLRFQIHGASNWPFFVAG